MHIYTHTSTSRRSPFRLVKVLSLIPLLLLLLRPNCRKQERKLLLLRSFLLLAKLPADVRIRTYAATALTVIAMLLLQLLTGYSRQDY